MADTLEDVLGLLQLPVDEGPASPCPSERSAQIFQLTFKALWPELAVVAPSVTAIREMMTGAGLRLKRWLNHEGELDEHHEELYAQHAEMLAQHYRQVAPGSTLPPKKYAYIPMTEDKKKELKKRENSLPLDPNGEAYTDTPSRRQRWKRPVGLSSCPFPGLRSHNTTEFKPSTGRAAVADAGRLAVRRHHTRVHRAGHG